MELEPIPKKRGRPLNPDRKRRHVCNFEGCQTYTYEDLCRKHVNPLCKHEGCPKRARKTEYCHLHSEIASNHHKRYNEKVSVRRKELQVIKKAILDEHYKPLLVKRK
jgi:hypothetical protein